MSEPTHEPSQLEQYSTPLVTKVVEEIVSSIENGWLEAIDELLRFCPRINLLQYLPEEEWPKYATDAELTSIYGSWKNVLEVYSEDKIKEMRDSIKPVHCSDSIKPVKKYCSACQVEHHDVCGLDLPESENCPCCQDTRNIMRDH